MTVVRDQQLLFEVTTKTEEAAARIVAAFLSREGLSEAKGTKDTGDAYG